MSMIRNFAILGLFASMGAVAVSCTVKETTESVDEISQADSYYETSTVASTSVASTSVCSTKTVTDCTKTKTKTETVTKTESDCTKTKIVTVTKVETVTKTKSRHGHGGQNDQGEDD